MKEHGENVFPISKNGDFSQKNEPRESHRRGLYYGTLKEVVEANPTIIVRELSMHFKESYMTVHLEMKSLENVKRLENGFHMTC